MNENCYDLRAHHGQCPRCSLKLPNADAEIAKSLALGLGSVGAALPRCTSCKVPVLFNGCAACGHLFANISWTELPKWDPGLSERLEVGAQARAAAQLLAGQVRAEAALLASDLRALVTAKAAASATGMKNRTRQSPVLPACPATPREWLRVYDT